MTIDDSDETTGCLQCVVRFHKSKELRPHVPLRKLRDDSHALTIVVDKPKGNVIRSAPNNWGSITMHDEYVVHGLYGNTCEGRQRKTYVLVSI